MPDETCPIWWSLTVKDKNMFWDSLWLLLGSISTISIFLRYYNFHHSIERLMFHRFLQRRHCAIVGNNVGCRASFGPSKMSGMCVLPRFLSFSSRGPQPIGDRKIEYAPPCHPATRSVRSPWPKTRFLIGRKPKINRTYHSKWKYYWTILT